MLSRLSEVRLRISDALTILTPFSASELSQELTGLEALEVQMTRNFEALQLRRENAKFAGTLKGRIFNWGGRLFTIYCIFRVISVSVAAHAMTVN